MKTALGLLLVAVAVYTVASHLPMWLDAFALGFCIGLAFGLVHGERHARQSCPDSSKEATCV